MILTEQQQKEFEAAARPLMAWMNANCHPHVTVIVVPDRAELMEGVGSFVTEEYIPD